MASSVPHLTSRGIMPVSDFFRDSADAVPWQNSETGMIPRLVKWGTLLAIAAILAISIYGMYLYGQIRNYAMRDEAQKADAIVVLGAAQYNGRPSPGLEGRVGPP